MRITKLIVSLMLLALVAISFAQSIPWVTWYPDSQGNPGTLPTFFSGTSSTVRFKTMYQYLGRTLSKISLFIGNDAAGEWTKPSNIAYVTEHTMTVRFDSSHFPHDTKVKLKAVVETSGFGNPIPPGRYTFETTAEIEIKNRIVCAADADSEFAPGAITALCIINNYERVVLDPESATRDQYCNGIKDFNVIATHYHGGTYGSGEGHLLPPGGGGHVTASYVGPITSASVPAVRMVFLLSCHAGRDPLFSGSYGSSVVTPWASTGFQSSVINQLALTYFGYVTGLLINGWSIEAANRLWYRDKILLDEKIDPWADERWTSLISQFGSPAQTIKNVYTGDKQIQSTCWFKVLP